jgi:hypothetical protein
LARIKNADEHFTASFDGLQRSRCGGIVVLFYRFDLTKDLGRDAADLL